MAGKSPKQDKAKQENPKEKSAKSYPSFEFKKPGRIIEIPKPENPAKVTYAIP